MWKDNFHAMAWRNWRDYERIIIIILIIIIVVVVVLLLLLVVVVVVVVVVLTLRSRVLPEKLTGSQLVKKFPAFYGTRRFITAFTSARHLSLSLATSIQSMPSHPTS